MGSVSDIVRWMLEMGSVSDAVRWVLELGSVSDAVRRVLERRYCVHVLWRHRGGVTIVGRSIGIDTGEPMEADVVSGS
ncbi:hypothetical protein R1flu_019998 [Riccia fluitans]|uniref:Uncharacterized protein n=1 Tax=Riccia fluitans TaxID=41844 RepID=A0ABD1ZK87_9MARC